jgi:hypothetical protein
VLSKFIPRDDKPLDERNADQLLKTIFKKYNLCNLPIDRKFSVRTLSVKPGQEGVLKTTIWKNSEGKLYFSSHREKSFC